MFKYILILTLMVTPAYAYDQRVQDVEKRAKTIIDDLPFKMTFDAPDQNFGGRSGRRGRPLRPNENMDFGPNRQPWDMGRDHGYPGPKLTLTFPF